MKKKLFAILLSIVMVAGLLPTVAFAAENYDLYVNGEQFTSEKLSIACGEGTASYDPNTKTLTLNNAAITNGGKSDESPKYGIRVVGDTDLTIKLSGTNSITLDNGGGIFADGSSDNYNIIGDGKLTINVKWDALYTLNGNISISEGAKLDITSAQGCGITSYNKGILSIDGAKVAVSSYYTAASAKELEIKNNSEVVLIASEDRFNAAYMGDENGAGKIEIINSKVEATSYYPALFTEGNLTVNGGEVKCTSTADGAIWTKGNILIKGGAKVTTDSKFPMGGNGTFTVEEAEIDAKNTNENNIPAIFDESVPVIADGYHLNYAKAVDSEGTEIDLLSSGTQYFALYKNVHFITKAVYPVSFVVTPDGLTNVVVKVNGQEVTGSVSLEAGTYPVEVTADNCKAYTDNITITADAATHTQTIAMTYLPADYTKVDAAIDKANALNKDEYKDFTAVEAAVNAVVRDKNITEQSEVDAMAKAIEDAIAALQYKDADYIKIEVPFKLTVKKTGEMDPGKETFKFAIERFGATTEYVLVQDTVETEGEKTYEGKFIFTIKENQAGNLSEGFVIRQVKGNAEGWTYDETKFYAIPMFADTYTNVAGWSFLKYDENAELDYNNPIEEIGFTNSYSAKKPVVPSEPTEPTKPDDTIKSPQTGDTSNMVLWIALLLVSGSAAIGTTVVSRKKKYNR
ncbi:sortase B protein-sorting domain-containing protein [Bariatricus massiliensis]|uniref:sortase B protein-sorting domain-containing protein n=1 Tax=Bariatricus massiliensis TaxID=1745713 RepID=UPI000835309C|nr:sortase B protein-sorting domain-containing protein [Bariatricus massiliensis]